MKLNELRKVQRMTGIVTGRISESVSDNDRLEALANHLGININEIIQESETIFQADGFEEDSEWIVLTDEEADKQTKDYIEEMVWAFNDWFIKNHVSDERKEGLDIDEVIAHYQSLSENGNDSILDLIEDLDEFVEDAINADGRGHFLSSYDGKENEQDGFYIYRIN